MQQKGGSTSAQSQLNFSNFLKVLRELLLTKETSRRFYSEKQRRNKSEWWHIMSQMDSCVHVWKHVCMTHIAQNCFAFYEDSFKALHLPFGMPLVEKIEVICVQASQEKFQSRIPRLFSGKRRNAVDQCIFLVLICNGKSSSCFSFYFHNPMAV